MRAEADRLRARRQHISKEFAVFRIHLTFHIIIMYNIDSVLSKTSWEHVMRTTAFAAALSAAFMAASASAEAQSGPLAAAPTSASGPFYQGLTLKAAQSCPRFPGEGITVTVRSVTEGGTAATVGVEVKCWGTSWVIKGNFTGSISTGNPARLLFTNGFGYGGEMTGSFTLENGKPVFTFAGAKLGQGYSSPPLWTDGAVLR